MPPHISTVSRKIGLTGVQVLYHPDHERANDYEALPFLEADSRGRALARCRDFLAAQRASPSPAHRLLARLPHLRPNISNDIPEPYAKETIDTKIFTRNSPRFENRIQAVAALGEITRDEAIKRLDRGDAIAVAYARAEPVGYGWVSFSSGAVELAFGVTWIVREGEAVRYGNFVHPGWRGRGIQSSINTAIVRYACSRGATVALASISTMNTQSMSLAKHYNRATVMKVMLILVRPFNWRICRASGAPFASRFLY